MHVEVCDEFHRGIITLSKGQGNRKPVINIAKDQSDMA
jgi:hypothetical protein